MLYQSGTFFSGFESSATSAGFTLFELAKNLDCQEKCRQDIRKAVDKHGLTYEAFNEMKYLEQAILEGVRLHPPVSTIDRYTRSDYTVIIVIIQIMMQYYAKYSNFCRNKLIHQVVRMKKHFCFLSLFINFLRNNCQMLRAY